MPLFPLRIVVAAERFLAFGATLKAVSPIAEVKEHAAYRDGAFYDALC